MRGVIRVSLGILAAVVLFAGTAAVLPFVVCNLETQCLDASEHARLRASRDIEFVQLSDGYTAFRVEGRENGPLVALVHGFSGPMAVWDHVMPALVGGGFRTVRYDLFGRGYSDRPDTAYTPELFDRQLTELLDRLDANGPIHLVGLSMGGAIVVHFTDRHPERVQSLSLLAPAGFPLPEPLRFRVLHWPGAGEWLFQVLGRSVLSAAIDHMNVPRDSSYRHDFMSQMTYDGFQRALLSTFRNMPLLTLEPVYRRVGAMQKPSLLIWGSSDHVLPFEHHKLVQDAMPHIEFHAIPGADHAACYEVPTKVNPILYEFLKRQTAS